MLANFSEISISTDAAVGNLTVQCMPSHDYYYFYYSFIYLFILVQVYSQHRPVRCYVLLGECFSLLWGTLEVLGSIAAL